MGLSNFNKNIISFSFVCFFLTMTSGFINYSFAQEATVIGDENKGTRKPKKQKKKRTEYQKQYKSKYAPRKVLSEEPASGTLRYGSCVHVTVSRAICPSGIQKVCGAQSRSSRRSRFCL